MRRRPPSILLSGALCLLIACGSNEADRGGEAAAPITVLVPQVMPAGDVALFWLDPSRVAAVGRRTFVWEPDSGRVLSITLTAGRSPSMTTRGLCTDSHCFDVTTGWWTPGEGGGHAPLESSTRSDLRAEVSEGEPRELLVRETATGFVRTRVLLPMRGCPRGIEALRLAGEVVAYECAIGGGVFHLDGREAFGFTRGFHIEQLSARGRLVYDLFGRLVVDDLEGGVIPWEGPLLAPFAVEGGHLFASLGAHVFELTPRPFALTRYGRCAPGSLAPLLERDGLRVIVRPNCHARSDGSEVLSDADPGPLAFARDRFVAFANGRLQVRDVDGQILSNLALDAGEWVRLPDVIIAMSPDAQWVLVSQQTRLRAFDAGSGTRVGEAVIGDRSEGMVFLDPVPGEPAVLAHVDREGRRTLFELPSLTVRAAWTGASAGDRSLVTIEGGLLDATGITIDRYDRAGHRLGSTPARSPARAIGDYPIALRPDVVVYDPTLTRGTPVAGAPITSTWADGHGERPWEEILTCVDGQLVRTDVVLGMPRSRTLGVPCDEWGVRALADRWLVISDDIPALLSPEDVRTDVLVAILGERAMLVAMRQATDGMHVRSDGIEVMGRSERMTSKEMRAVPSEGPIDVFFAQ